MSDNVLTYLREIGGSFRTAEEIATHLSIDPKDARDALIGLDLRGFVKAARGKNGATTYRAVRPGTWIPWK